jgi:hypothetical protein
MTKTITQTKRYFIFERSDNGKLKHPAIETSWSKADRFDAYGGYENEDAAITAIRKEMEKALSYDKNHWFGRMEYLILPVYTFGTESV